VQGTPDGWWVCPRDAEKSRVLRAGSTSYACGGGTGRDENQGKKVKREQSWRVGEIDKKGTKRAGGATKSEKDGGERYQEGGAKTDTGGRKLRGKNPQRKGTGGGMRVLPWRVWGRAQEVHTKKKQGKQRG